MGEDFVRCFYSGSKILMLTTYLQMNFLANLVKIFPNLKTRPLHLTGESYAGTYIVSVLLP